MNSKVSRLIDEYDLSGMGERLADFWLSDGSERHSLRDLADHFNRELLHTAMDDVGIILIDISSYADLAG